MLQLAQVVSTIHFQIFRFMKWRDRYKTRRRAKRRKQSAPVDKALSPRMSEDNSEPVYQDITVVDRLAHTSHIYQNLVESPQEDLPPPAPALFSNMTFSTISQDTQSLTETVEEGSTVAPTNIVPPNISRYDSLVTWLKNMSTGVQE